jgi:hypothetical protein
MACGTLVQLLSSLAACGRTAQSSRERQAGSAPHCLFPLGLSKMLDEWQANIREAARVFL